MSIETTLFDIFTGNAGVAELISTRFYPFNSVPPGADLPRAHYLIDKDHINAVTGVAGHVQCGVKIQWVAGTEDACVALAEAGRQLSGTTSATVQSLFLEHDDAVIGQKDPGSSTGLYVIEQDWSFNLSESIPTL